jgi:Ca-activated chloride channel family protein
MPEQTMTAPCGLIARDGAQVPLTGVSVDADVRALGARVTITQRYENTETQPIEAVYVFPLDEGAAVCGFEAVIDGVRIVGEVKDREEAFRAYDEAMSEGHGAYLLDEERPDVFQASVGNLPPGARGELTIVYVVELDVAEDAVRFVLPTTVAPRYAPVEDRHGVGRPDSDTLNPSHALDVPYGLDLRVRLATPKRPSRVSSPSHPIDVAFEDDAVVVSLSQRETPLDRDFVLSIEGGGFDVPSAWAETSPQGDRAIAVSFVPRLSDEPRPAEVIFVVDRSGSMQGTSIAEVRNALQLCLRSMIAGCRFNIVGFGSHVEQLFEGSRPYDEASLAVAAEHVRALDADLGGTEILEPLRRVFAQPVTDGAVRQVVVLTDGEVTNTDEVLKVVKENASSHRVFAMGIGAGASAHLVRGMARAGGGTAEFVAPGERVEPKVLRRVGRILSPALTGIRVSWDGLEVQQAPSTPPAVFHGSRLVLYGFAKTLGAGRLRLQAVGPDGPIAFEVPIEASQAVPGAVIATLAARARIRELEEGSAWLQTRGSRQQRGQQSAATREVIALAVRYGLVSRETSYVAIERREVPVVGDVQLRQVPIALTHGWGGGRLEHRVAFASLDAPTAASPRSARLLACFHDMDSAAEAPFEVSRRADLVRAPAGVAGRQTPLRDAVLDLVQRQHADGRWEFSPDLAQVLEQDWADLAHSFEVAIAWSGLTASDESASLWATALALAWLRVRAPRFENEWRMVARKAVDALRAGLPSEAFDRWVDEAELAIL